MLTVLLGGARSGKSSTAAARAARSGQSVTYVATSPHITGDDELRDRIVAHRAERPAHWVTVEQELDLAAALAAASTDLVIIDCLTVWVGNLLHHGHDEADVLRRSDDALAAIRASASSVTAISNEVGLGIVPDNELSRRYRDVLGRVNQQWVAASDRALFVVAGRALPLQSIDELLP